MKSAGKARNNGLYRHIRTSNEIIGNLLNDSRKFFSKSVAEGVRVYCFRRNVTAYGQCLELAADSAGQ